MKKTIPFWLTFCLLQPTAQAQTTDPWFEIEIIAFERGSVSSAREQFSQEIKVIPLRSALDLFKPLYQPDTRTLEHALPDCTPTTPLPSAPSAVDWQMLSFAEPLWVDEVSLASQSLALYQGQWPTEPTIYWPVICKTRALPKQGMSLPVFNEILPENPGPQLLAVEPPISAPVAHQNAPYLVDSSALQLKDLAWQLSRRGGHKLLLHTAWRAALGSKNQSQPLRFFAGHRFSPQFDYFGALNHSANQPEPSYALTNDSDSLQQAIDLTYRQLQKGRQLQSATPRTNLAILPQQVWQLDGLVRAYNQRMLFAETQFNFRHINANGEQLDTYYSSDTVRLLLGELHYLDHPKFGLVLQIRRFTPPLLTEGTTP